MIGKTPLLWFPGLALLLAGITRPLLLHERLSVWIMFALTIAVSAVLRFTVLGRNIYAVGGNAEAARLSGISVDRYRMGAFVVNGWSPVRSASSTPASSTRSTRRCSPARNSR